MNSATPSQGKTLSGQHVRIGASQYLVCHLTVKDFIRCAPNGDTLGGSNEAGCVFENIAEAQQYCRWKVDQNPKLGCTICDYRWKIVD